MNTTRIIRWLIIALVLSLSINMFVAGWYAGQVGHVEQSRQDTAKPQANPLRATLDSLSKDLSPESARLLRRALRARTPEIRPELQNLRQARKELRNALAAEPFDEGRVTKAQQSIRRSTAILQNALHETLVDVAAKMPAHDRQLLARFREEFR